MTAGFRWPPEIAIVAVIMTDSTTACASAMPSSRTWRRGSTLTTTDADTDEHQREGAECLGDRAASSEGIGHPREMTVRERDGARI